MTCVKITADNVAFFVFCEVAMKNYRNNNLFGGKMFEALNVCAVVLLVVLSIVYAILSALCIRKKKEFPIVWEMIFGIIFIILFLSEVIIGIIDLNLITIIISFIGAGGWVVATILNMCRYFMLNQIKEI